MNNALTDPQIAVTPRSRETLGQKAEARHEKWAHCHVNWTAISVGTLAALTMLLLFGLVSIALGAQMFGPEHRVVDLKKIGIGTAIFSVCGAFFSFVVAGWVAGKIAGILHSEPAMLHGAIVWLAAVPIVMAAVTLGAASFFGSWFSGLGDARSWLTPSTPFVRPEPLTSAATPDDIAAYRTQMIEYDRNVKQWIEDTPKVTRNTALGAVTAMLLGLMGAVIGGWMASGEPMNFSHYRTRKPLYHTS